MVGLPDWARRIDMDTELPKAMQLVLGSPDRVVQSANSGDPGWWQTRRVLTATAYGALASSGTPAMALANFPNVLLMTVRQASQITWGIGAQLAKANGYAASDFVHPAADLVGTLAVWAKVTLEHVQQAILWVLPKVAQAVQVVASLPKDSLAAEWLSKLGRAARSRLNMELVSQIFRYNLCGFHLAGAAIGGLGAYTFMNSTRSAARRYYGAKLALQSA